MADLERFMDDLFLEKNNSSFEQTIFYSCNIKILQGIKNDKIE